MEIYLKDTGEVGEELAKMYVSKRLPPDILYWLYFGSSADVDYLREVFGGDVVQLLLTSGNLGEMFNTLENLGD